LDSNVESVNIGVKIPPHTNITFMLTIGVLTRGKYGRRLLDTLAAHTIQGHLSRNTHPTSSLSLGAQSGSQKVLDGISRGHTVEDVVYAVE